MISHYIERAVRTVPGLHEVGMQASTALHETILSNNALRGVADILHGTWVGHPLHPILTDLAIGAWTFGILFDGVAASNSSREAERIADTMTTIGVVSAVPTAITGMVDYSTIPEPATAAGTLHGMLNSAGLILYLLSLRDRKGGQRGRAVVWAALAYGLLLFSAWLGGDMVYRHRVGVNHNEPTTKPERWMAVMDEKALREHEAKRIEVEGQSVLLYRYGGTVYAIGAVCSHAGGPLEEGKFDGHCVQCPWHDSVFDLRDGTVVHGPSTYTQPKYTTRLRDGKIELRLERGEDIL
jgi:nitrite reductase/ring-hydroxylating ferredoxin subunit/uncharacterized membrane protein